MVNYNLIHGVLNEDIRNCIYYNLFNPLDWLFFSKFYVRYFTNELFFNN